jgi:chromosomal replication initiator protein
MASVDRALWRDIMGYLRSRHPSICRQWFQELEPLVMDSGLLQIKTLTAVQQNYLQKKCLDQFTEAAQSATGALIAVRFVTGDEAANVTAPAPSQDKMAANKVAAPAAARSTASFSAYNDDDDRDGSDMDVAEPIISPDYSFDNFVTGPGNHLAYAAAVAVANQPGTAYNPLFIHGGVGLGKTHLLQAICQQLMHNSPGIRIHYLSCDTFINHFMKCVQSGQMSEFRHRYRHVDVMVIDDIHFLANRDRTQEEFFHTFNELYQSNKQIVLSSDSPPSEIPQLEERLVSRFQWGLVAHVSKPCYETRVAIIQAKSKLRGLEMPDDVVAYIAQRIDSNARELEGALTTIQGHSVLENRPIDLNLAYEVLGEPKQQSGNGQVTLQDIIAAVTSFYSVRLSDLQSKRRHKSITGPRQVCMWLARKRTRFSLEEIGGYFGGRDHTTVMHSIRTVDARMKDDPNFATQVEQLDSGILRSVGGN